MRLHNILNEEVEGVVLCGTVVPFLQDETIFETVKKKVEDGQGVIADNFSDPMNTTASLTLETLYNFLVSNEYVNADAFYEKFPKHVSVLQVAGDQDPVEMYGEGVYRVANGLLNAGVEDVTTIMFSSYRHEVHNEPELRDEIVDVCLIFYAKEEM